MKPRKSRWWRWLLAGLGLVLGLLLVVGVLLQTPFAREQVRLRVNTALAPVFEGRLRIERIGGLGLWGVSGVDARVFDPQGRQVIRVQGLEARASLPRLGWQLAFGKPAARLELDRVRIAFADVTLREDEELGVTLARAFLPVETAPAATETRSGRSVELGIAAIEIDRVWAHGRASGSPWLDADLLDLRADLSQAETGFLLELQRAELVTRALPGAAEPRGTVWGAIDVPSDGEHPLRLEGYFDGQAAGSPLWLETSWVGDDLYARASLPRLPAAYVNSQVSGLQLQGELNVLGEVQGTLPELDFSADVRAEAAHVAVSAHAVVSGGLEAVAAIATSGVNLAGILDGAPPSSLQTRADLLLLETDEGSYVASHHVEVDQGRLDGIPTPRAQLSGRLAFSDEAGLSAWGDFSAEETRADLGGQYRARLHDEARDFVAISVQGKLEDPARLSALGVKTAGNFRGQAELRPHSNALDAKLDLDLRRLEYGAFQARSVEAQAQASGSLKSPRVHAAATLNLLSGRAHADLSYSEQGQELSVFLADIDGQRLASLFELQLPVQQANLNLDARVRRTAGRRLPLQVDGKLRADFGRVGAVEVRATELALPENFDDPRRLQDATGELAAAGSLDLSKVDKLAQLLGFPLERATGKLRFELSGRQAKDSKAGPELSLLLDTNGLRILERRAPVKDFTTTAEAIENEPFALEGIDAHASLRFLPMSGETVGTVIVRDRGGMLAKLEAEAKLGSHWPRSLNQQALLHTPLALHLEVPTRRLQSLPALVRPAALRGRLELDGELEGSLADPHVRAWLTLQRLGTQRGDERLDLRATVRYSLQAGELFVTAADSHGRDAARVNAHWQGDLVRFVANPSESGALVASVDTELFGVPLEVVPWLSDRQVKGRLSGKASLRDWGQDARLEVELRGRDLLLGTARLPSVLLTAHNRQADLLAQVSADTGKGSLRATLETKASWGAKLAPELERRGVAKLSAKRFELNTLTPMLGAYVSELSGVLDADAEVRVDGAATRVAGTASLEQGVVQVPAVGQRFSDINAKVAVSDNQFKLEQLEARGITGRVSARGAARLDGFTLRSAEARCSIKKNEALPITIEGAALGDAWGNVEAKYTSPPTGERRLDIDVPEFHLTTPDTEGHGLQSLDNAQDIRIGTRRTDGTFVALPVQPLEPDSGAQAAAGEPVQPLRIQIKLGQNVTVARGNTAQAQLGGQLVAISNGETHVTGRIEVRGGKLEVQGKIFEIERGVVTFDGRDPENPTITATARWDGPEHTVYADYVGDLKDGRIKLRAEPPLSQDQLASLLLFGDPDGSAGGGTDTAALAVSVAGDTAAKGLNQVLSDFTNLDVRARVDTTTGNARPELSLQVSRRVVAKVTRAIGAPAVGESPDRTFLTVELRLRRAWALSAIFGDHGASALDLIWRRRY